MDFSLSKSQKLIQNSARAFFEKECPKEKTRALMQDPAGYDPSMWQKMVDLGFVGITIPEAFGGMQSEFTDLELLMEEMGRNIVPGPYFQTVCLCARALTLFGNEDQQQRYLPEIAEKGEIWSFALDETGVWKSPPDIRTRATISDHGVILNGTKVFVPYARAADYMIVAANTDTTVSPKASTTLLIVDTKTPGIEMEEIPTIGPGLKYAVTFNNVMVPAENILGVAGNAMTMIDAFISEGALLRAAEMSGGAQAALDLSLDYAKKRCQFDRPIGSFQVLQHKLVKMLQEVDGLRNQVREAAWRITMGQSSPLLNAMAKTKANTVYDRVCRDAVVIYGAIGWTAEMDVGLYLLRAKDLTYDCGSSDYHREKIATILMSATSGALATVA
ncbi:acyl-CoA/acyl-ACP dehydrogenase [Desulfosarcina sp. OttesenSCG-928-A07]|nr:acyl-CoA/acyl-ACP dehydrogenase [Desulfosarcina sp. OttesenSCG-928-G17]MDL2328983.1 acyl-CoA/acyl-ACP dehydrogenase [Desulfosarcina sp. OttesenSCG-928-A07]